MEAMFIVGMPAPRETPRATAATNSSGEALLTPFPQLKLAIATSHHPLTLAGDLIEPTVTRDRSPEFAFPYLIQYRIQNHPAKGPDKALLHVMPTKRKSPSFPRSIDNLPASSFWYKPFMLDNGKSIER